MSETPFADTTRWIGIPSILPRVTGAPLNEVNHHPCGLDPVEFNIVIDQDAVEEKTKGGLILIDQEKQKHMATRGVIVEMSPFAWTYADWPAGSRTPKIGDRVLYVQYAGKLFLGEDGKEYRAIKDKDIIGVFR